MDFFDVLKKRKTIRSYLPGKKIPKKDLHKILTSASLAPSARNLQSYKIFIADNPEKINLLFPVFFNQRSDFIKSSSLILVFCADPVPTEKVFGARGKKLYCLQDATIACCFALLAAIALGYATCWVGNFRDEKLRRILNTNLIPVACLIIGFSTGNPPKKQRKKLSLLASSITV